MATWRATVIAGIAALALAACTGQPRTHGYAPTDDELANVIVGIDTQGSVEDTLGRPSAQGVVTDSAWFYLSSTRTQYGPLRPRILDRQLVAVRFDGDGVVSNVERFGLEDGRVVPLSRRVTTSNVRDTTFLRQLLGNIGRVDPGAVLGGSP